MNHNASALCLLLTLMLVAAMASGQTEPESATLTLESRVGTEEHTLRVGDRVHYQVAGGRMQRKGTLTAVQDSSITVAGKQIAYRDIDLLVHVKARQQKVGAAITIGSAIAEPIALLLFVVTLLFALDNPTPGQRFLIAMMGVITLALLPIALVVGIVLLATGSRRFDLRSRWRIRN
jgi:hypothetical protein